MQEFIDSLPLEMQPIAKRYILILNRMTVEGLQLILDYLQENQWSGAYYQISGAMTPDERDAEQTRVAEDWRNSRTEEMTVDDMQQAVVSAFISSVTQVLFRWFKTLMV